MSQLYYQDSGAMIDQGKTAAEYQTTDPFWSWDPAVHAIANSSQTFPANWKRGGRWMFVPSIGEFFQRKFDMHPFLVAAASLFPAAQWEEIEDSLEEFGDVNRLLRQRNFKKFRRKITRARLKGLITVAEAQSLRDVIAHFPNGA